MPCHLTTPLAQAVLLVAGVTFGFVEIVVFSVVLFFPLLHFLLGINPWLTWSLQGEIYPRLSWGCVQRVSNIASSANLNLNQ